MNDKPTHNKIINSIFITKSNQNTPILIWKVSPDESNGFDIHVQLVNLVIGKSYPVNVKINSFDGQKELLNANDKIRITASDQFIDKNGIAEIKLPVTFDPKELINIPAISATITIDSEQTVVCLYLEDENIG